MIHYGLKGHYTAWLRAPDGAMRQVVDQPNRITDPGLALPNSFTWARCMSVFVCGTGSTLVEDSDDTLETYLARSTDYGLGACGYSQDAVAKTVTLWRVCDVWTNATGSTVTVHELGVGPTNADNPPIFSRTVISGGVAVPDGYTLVVRYTLTIGVPLLSTPTDVTLTIGGTSVPGKIALVPHQYGAFYTAFNRIGTDGGEIVGNSAEYIGDPSLYGICRMVAMQGETGNYADLSSSSVSVVASGTLFAYLATHVASGATESRLRNVLSPADLNGATITGFVWGYGTTNSSPAFVFRADAPFTKPVNAQWTVDLIRTWGRA